VFSRSPGRALSARPPLAVLLMVPILLLSAAPGPRQRAGGEPRATFPDGHAFKLEIARTPAEMARGYMYRDKVGRREGMLFLFPDSDFHSFWMKNCRIPLDIIWMDQALRVVHVEPMVPPCRADPCPGYMPMMKARYVLEVRAGMSESAGLRIGDTIRIEGVDWGAPVEP
jgi:uncharacterized protein